tara:strand:+ start:5066 stop:7168 length:2103 start_codon:yes stop_codon:yes gene_type:complete
MSAKTYVVTLYKHEDLPDFYDEMKANGYQVLLKRPLSRNTHYLMTEEQAVELRKDSRVWDVQLTPEELGMTIEKNWYTYPNEYEIGTSSSPATFWKSGSYNQNSRQWGQHFCTRLGVATTPGKGKGTFGVGANGTLNDYVTVYGNGKDVDVVIVDDPVSYDCEEWYSPSSGTTRFVQYQWFDELNTYVAAIDDDSQTLPQGTISYYDNAANPEYHGVHVAGTVAGQFYGWANEANIYGLQILGNMPSGHSLPVLLLFDYLRAFHAHKPLVNGKRLPTISNHSWGYSYNLSGDYPSGYSIGDVQYVYDSSTGTTYDSNNPNPSGWTIAGLAQDFGVDGTTKLNAPYAALEADCEDAINDGIILVGAAGNNNQLMVDQSDNRYGSVVRIGGANYPMYQGSAPVNSPQFISVGAISNYADFRRASFSNYGPKVDIWAPGQNIISAFNSSGFSDGKYGGAPNYYYSISGTSMASPQVAGILAVYATGKSRFTHQDALRYLTQHNSMNDFGRTVMDWDIGGDPPATYSVDIQAPNASYYTLNGTDRKGVVQGNNVTISLNQGDTLELQANAGGHPVWVKTQATVGQQYGVPNGITNNGITSGTITWDTTATAPGTYYYICEYHGSMNGQIIISAGTAGTQADNTCQQGSPDRVINLLDEDRGAEIDGGRQENDQLRKGLRINTLNVEYTDKPGQIYPRPNIYFGP